VIAAWTLIIRSSLRVIAVERFQALEMLYHNAPTRVEEEISFQPLDHVVSCVAAFAGPGRRIWSLPERGP
jgi:hypothetical protein